MVRYAASIISFSLIAAAIFLVHQNPSEGYEPSIYASVSPLVWVFLITSILCGIYIAAQDALKAKDGNGKWFLIGLCIIVLGNVVIMLLPALKGYYFYGRMDFLVHSGVTTDFILAGKVPEYVVSYHTISLYPALYILLASISLLTGVGASTLLFYIAPFMYLLYLLFIYTLATVVLNNKRMVKLAILASTVLFVSQMNYQVLGTILSFYMLPLALYAYFQVLNGKSFGFTLILLLSAILLPFLHPFACLAFIAGILFMEFSRVACRSLGKIKGNQMFPLLNNRRWVIYPPLIALILFIIWFINNWHFWRYSIDLLSGLLTGERIAGGLRDVTSTLVGSDVHGFEAIALFLKFHGHHLIYIVLALIAGALITRKVLSGRDGRAERTFVLFACFIAIALLSLFHLFGVAADFGYWRLIVLTSLLTPIFIGLLSGGNIYRYRSHNLAFGKLGVNFIFIGLIFILMAPSLLGIFSFYPSPLTHRLNEQITRAEKAGMNWFYKYEDLALPITQLNVKQLFAVETMGMKKAEDRGDTLMMTEAQFLHKRYFDAPDHFEYGNFTAYEDTSEVYLVLSEYDYLYYTTVFSKKGRYNLEDFEALTSDTRADKCYTNHDLKVYLININKHQGSDKTPT
jgi:hypothetical protein